MKIKDYIAIVVVGLAILVSFDLVLDFSGRHMLTRMTGYRFELVKVNGESESLDGPSSVEYVLPDEAVGSGEFNISSPSGSSEFGQTVTIYKDSGAIGLQIGISARNLGGSLLTYFYIDGEEVTSHQVGVGYDGSINIPDAKATVGQHKVHAVQYKDNDKSKGFVFNKVQIFEIKAK